MKKKLITLLTVATVSVGSFAAIAAIVATNKQSENLSHLSADDTRVLEVTAEDIGAAIGAGGEGTFTKEGIGFHFTKASYADGVVTFGEGYFKTTVTAGSTTGESGLAGAGYTELEFVNLDFEAGAVVESLDDDENQLGLDTVVANTSGESYKVNLKAHETAARKVTNVYVGFASPGANSFTSLKLSYTCAVPAEKHLVRFISNGNVVATQHVVHGQKATAPSDPTRPADAENARYEFTGWDNDPATTVINEDTDFWAQYKVWAREEVLDDFESYTFGVPAELEDAGWYATVYQAASEEWEKEGKQTVSISKNSVEDEQALRLDAFRNGMDYKMLKEIDENPFKKLTNAVKLSIMAPENPEKCEVLLHANLMDPIKHEVLDTPLIHDIPLTSSGYTEYVIPYDAGGWRIWEADIPDLRAGAEQYYHIDIDTFAQIITSVEVYFKYPSNSPANYCAFLDSFSFVTTDSTEVTSVETMAQYNRFTGKNVLGNTVSITINNDLSATAKVLDAETPVQIPGNVTINGNEMTFASADSGSSLSYTGRATNGGKKVMFVESGGTYGASVNGMNLDAVQVVDNYEQYGNNEGTMYYQGSSIDQRSGCRGAYYCEYYAGSGTPSWGGTGWTLMGGSGDQLRLKTDGGHAGTNYMAVKNANSVGMRYMTWELFDKTADKKPYRGSTFSFWAKTNGWVPGFKIYVMRNSAPTPSMLNDGTYYSMQEFREEYAVSDWKHYEIELNPTVDYYGFILLVDKNNGSSETWLRLDDFEVYTGNPYATYVAPVEPTDAVLTSGMTYTAKIGGGLGNTMVEITGDGTAKLSIPGYGVTVNGTYSTVLQSVTFTFGGTTLTGTISNDGKKITSIAATGSDPYTALLNGIGFSMIEYADNAETYESSGVMYYRNNTQADRSGARGAYFCDYYSGGSTYKSPVGGSGWELMGGSGDQLSLDTTTSVDGSKSLKMKYSSSNLRYLQWQLKSGTGPSYKYNSFGIYMKNPNASAVQVKILVYYVRALTPTTQGSSSTDAAGTYRTNKTVTLAANSDWTFYSLSLDTSKTYYGYGINTVSKDAGTGYFNVDRAFYYNDYESPDMTFFAKDGLSLAGSITAGDASISFGTKGVATLTCAALGGSVKGTYSFAMDGNDQILTIKAKVESVDSTMYGTYTVSPTGVVTFTIKGATGAFAAAVAADQTLSNS